MGWVKLHLDDGLHRQLKKEAIDFDMTLEQYLITIVSGRDVTIIVKESEI